MWWFKKKENSVKYLIVGLGNIGLDYKGTRHNIGFDVVDQWAADLEASFDTGRLAFVAKAKFRGKQIIMIKPTTYMNLSGKAIRHWMKSEKIPLERILIITDDIALPLAKIRLKTKGSHGGHNGLKDTIAQLGTDQFPRIRFGVGSDFPKGRQVEYVLGKWEPDETIDVKLGIEKAVKLTEAFIVQGAERAMNHFN
ncbi:MAG: aminoacyl-tRNA hydrolase [Bacteroidia bacterium]